MYVLPSSCSNFPSVKPREIIFALRRASEFTLTSPLTIKLSSTRVIPLAESIVKSPEEVLIKLSLEAPTCIFPKLFEFELFPR